MDRALPHRGTRAFCSEPFSLEGVIPQADVLLIVPPFSSLSFPCMGAHLLQACAREAGFNVAVLYAGMLLAREISQPVYEALSVGVTFHRARDRSSAHLLGERIFASAAYGLPALGRGAEARLTDGRFEVALGREINEINHDLLLRLASHAEGWVERLADAITAMGFAIVGCSIVFDQTAAGVAILRQIKRRRPEVETILGGANCAGEMGTGIASLASEIDFVFSGESEEAFCSFLAGARPAGRLIEGEPCMNLDALPVPDFGDYYRQRRAWMEDDAESLDRLMLLIETSRGCWWGQKHHCTFCGISEMAHREKSPDRVLDELRSLLASHPSRRVFAVDNIMPYSYFHTLLPRLSEEIPGLTMFYEVKANLDLKRITALARAGITSLQPGVEALSSPLLRRMDKGTLARHNIALLRYACSAHVSLYWQLIYGFPGDQAEDYAHYLTLFPLLHHLQPPRFFMPLCLFRFSPYVNDPERYGIRNLRPAEVYRDILPEGADIDAIAYQFDGEYPSVATEHPDLVDAIEAAVRAWRGRWDPGARRAPVLSVRRLDAELFVLTDRRGLPGGQELQPITRRQAAAALVGRPLADLGPMADEGEWARRNGYAVELDRWHVPLATAPPDLLEELEHEHGPSAAPSTGDDDRPHAPLLSLDALIRSAHRTPG